jgi:uncharacterized protein (TIGR02466 family)
MKRSSIKKHFATPIYYTPLMTGQRGKRFHSELAEECYRIRDLDRVGQAWCQKNYVGGYTSYSSIANLHERSHSFITLEKQIRKHVYAFAKELRLNLGDRPLVMSDFWVNIMPTAVTHALHLHPLSVISGTYYVQTPRGCSSISFEDPRLPMFMASPPRYTDAQGNDGMLVSYPAKAGNLVLFESWLRHQVSANPSKEDRISVSFNYAWG